MRTTRSIVLALAVLLASALPVTADVRTGDRNFERAWRVYVTRNTERAMEYFKASAAGYEDALKMDPMERTMNFESTQIKASIAFYFAGQFQACVKTAKTALGDKNKIWDAALFMALAQGRMGDQDAMTDSFKLFLDANPSQRYITTELSKDLPALTGGTMSLADFLDAMDSQVQRQFVDNVMRYNNRAGMIPATESCDGQFWWRKNSSPCMRGVYPGF
ncbi:hypothetical protein [Pseudodesulfovibrio indicus]|uniref:Uncharacterized protein n=1 Tax=Pseudodesulfovibrio indicus TaxID=1716143 RepID=A0A126QT76_9BACT|nr:hypothetical protein [Pseudodesulfovibrio indicus]AMK12645.1 hypothetical protein AWY79_16790 [Pseudodesulfovibrio indicus]TDT90958.1 hypothetical protein EDC59_102392 [Pseudodesulfovibrio indicus]